jgi:hypothetical protein
MHDAGPHVGPRPHCTVPRGSAAGLSRWTYERIRTAATASAHGFQAVLQMLNVLLDGTLPYIAELLYASLIGIQKPGGGVRPIAIAEVWHRLAGLCAMKGCAAGMELHPLQVAGGVPGGSGCIGHALHAGMLADTECVTIQEDFGNTFNSLRRDAALAAVCDRAPSLVPFIQWTYHQHKRLFVRSAPQGSEPLLSQSGVRQSDPCGMLVFCLTLQTPLEYTQQLHPQTWVLAFADDRYFQGPPRPAVAAFHSLSDLAATIGLHMQLPKCSVYGHDTVAAEEMAQELGIGHAKAGMMA